MSHSNLASSELNGRSDNTINPFFFKVQHFLLQLKFSTITTLYAGNGTYAASDSTTVTVTVQSIPPPNKTKTQLSLYRFTDYCQQYHGTNYLYRRSQHRTHRNAWSKHLWSNHYGAEKRKRRMDQHCWKDHGYSGSVIFVRPEVFKGTYHYRLYYAGTEVFEASKSNE